MQEASKDFTKDNGRLEVLIRIQEGRIGRLNQAIQKSKTDLEYYNDVDTYSAIIELIKNSKEFCDEWNNFMTFVKLFCDPKEYAALGGK